MSEDHKPDNEKEKKRIERAGGFVLDGRVNKNLNLSRSIGDLEFKSNKNLDPKEQIISAFPDVMTYSKTGDENFIIMGCDGIWETRSNKQIGSHVKKRLNQNPFVCLSVVAEDLLDELITLDVAQGKGCDNMSTIIIKFSN